MSTQIKTIIAGAACALLLATTGSIAHAGRGGSAPAIRAAVANGSTDAIIAEIERAERLVCADCVDPIMDLLDDERPEIREVAAWWMARRPALKVGLTTRSLEDLAGNDARLVRNAADILGTFRHPDAIVALAAASSRGDLTPEAKAAVVKALGTIGHRTGSTAIAAAMADATPAVRIAALDAWQAIRKQQGAAPAVPLLADADATVRARAAATVGQLHEATARAALEAMVANDASPAVRRNAAWALGRIGDPASRAVLEAATRDPSSLVRGTARGAMSQLR